MESVIYLKADPSIKDDNSGTGRSFRVNGSSHPG